MKQLSIGFGARLLFILTICSLAMGSCSKDAFQDEFTAPQSERDAEPDTRAEPAPHTVKILCTPEPTGADKSVLELNVEYTFQAIYIDWAAGPVAQFDYTIFKAFLNLPTYIRRDTGNGTMKVTFTSRGTCRILLRCLNYDNNNFSKTYQVGEEIIHTGPVIVS